jgi:hypothetical protein
MNFKKPSRIIGAAAIALVLMLSVGFAVNRVVDASLIEMKIIYEENPSHFLVVFIESSVPLFADVGARYAAAKLKEIPSAPYYNGTSMDMAIAEALDTKRNAFLAGTN